jgi:succinate dehydrogenase/fumarate reductase cytochrome b subunit
MDAMDVLRALASVTVSQLLVGAAGVAAALVALHHAALGTWNLLADWEAEPPAMRAAVAAVSGTLALTALGTVGLIGAVLLGFLRPVAG